MNSFRKLLLALTAGALAFGATLLAGCGKQGVKKLEPAKPVATQSVTITDAALEAGVRDTLKFGKMHQGEIIAKSLRVENGNERPIVLLRHITTCGCVNVVYDRKPIAKGESATIEFELDSKSLQGWQMKLMEFYFADKDTPMKIYIEAEVE